MTNREDPDQTAPWGAVWSGSALFAQTYLSQYLKLLRYAFFSFQNNPKDLDPSYKMYLDIWDRFGRKELCPITEEIWKLNLQAT